MEAITFRCSACNHGIKVAADKAGRKAKCPKCKTELTIPQPEAVTPAAAPAPAPDPAKPEEEDEFKVGGSYNVLIDKDEEERKRRLEEEERAKKRQKKPAPRIEIKKKELKDKRKWLQVRRCLPIFLWAVGVWGVAILLQTLPVVIGMFSSDDYTAVAVVNLLEEIPDPVPPNFVPSADPIRFSLGLIAGAESAGAARILHIIAILLMMGKGGLFLTGYFLAMPVPDRYGSRAQLKTLIILGCVNLVLLLALKLLPMLGLYPGWIPLLTPEVCMVSGNIERSLPTHVFWTTYPFLIEILTQIVLFLQYLEPILVGVFLWTCGVSMKEDDMEKAGLGISGIGFGLYFLLMCYHVVSCCGTSDVLIGLLRVLYGLWVAFSFGWVYRFITVLLLARDTFDKRIFGIAYADELEDDDDEDEDED
jgi:phage FluMu protein Com